MKYVSRQEMAQRAKELRYNMTPAERRLWFGFLRGYPVSFRPQKVVGRYILDFYSRKVRLAVELDGGQHFDRNSMQYDEQRTRFLEMNEIKVLRFSNNDVFEYFEDVCEVIHQQVCLRRNDYSDNNFQKLLKKH